MNRSRLDTRPARQRGQTVLWFLATVASCCCIFALVYNVGQVANEKEKAVNAADASALSGALVEARMLNFQAYTNRAMIANEVTVAQLVSLDSWVQYDNELLYWIATYTSIIPYVDDVTQALSDVAQEVATGVNEFTQGALYVVEADNAILYGARAVAYGLGPVAANDIASQVAGANSTTFDGRYDAQPQMVETFRAAMLVANSASWLSFISTNADDKRADAKAVILNSRDPFSTYRNEGYLIQGISDALSVATGISTGGLAYLGLTKTSGGTQLDDYDHWVAQDSLDQTVSTLQFILGFIPDGYSTQVDPASPPLGYGRVDADKDGSVGDDNLCSQTTVNCTLAVDNAKALTWKGTTGNGIPNIYDLSSRMAKSDDVCATNNGSDGATLAFVSGVQKDGQATQTTQRLGSAGLDTADVAGPQGSPKMTDNLQNGDKMTSIGAACTFFLRPDLNASDRTQASLARSDGVHEYASLYNPYWQARLTQPSDTYKAGILAAIGADPLLAAVTP